MKNVSVEKSIIYTHDSVKLLTLSHQEAKHLESLRNIQWPDKVKINITTNTDFDSIVKAISTTYRPEEYTAKLYCTVKMLIDCTISTMLRFGETTYGL